MSIFKRVKALFTESKNDVMGDKNRKKSDKQADLRPKQSSSNIKKEKIANKSKAKKYEEKTKTKIKVVEVPTTTPEDKKARENNAEEIKTETAKENKNPSNDSKNKEKKRDIMTLLNNNENKLTLEAVDPEFTQIFKDAGIDSVELCFQCGTCTGGCPSGRRTPYRIRQLVKACLMGLKNRVISDDSLWMCTTCYTCQERCPREIKIVEIVKMARNIAAQNGFMALNHKKTGSFVIKTGHGVPINDATKELRKRVGLDELPPTTHSFPEALEEVQKICEVTGFDDLIGYNKVTGELE